MADLPSDASGDPIPVLYPETPHKIISTGSSTRNSTALVSDVVRLYADAALNFKFGDSSVTATTSDHYIPAGVPYDFRTKGKTHIAIIGSGNLYVSELT